MVGRKALWMFLLLSLGLVAATFHPAQNQLNATIDFSGLAEGAIVSSLSHGAGISGDEFEGSITVFGSNPNPVNPDDLGKNHAMIFDATCAGGCSGGDDDLYWPELGNMLIISENLNSDDPDDADEEESYFFFDFSELSPATVFVESLIVGDVETDEGGEAIIFTDQDEITREFPPTGDAVYELIEVNAGNVNSMRVNLNGSGAIDNIKIRIEEPEQDLKITLQGTCEPTEQYSEDLRLTGSLKLDDEPVTNHAITLKFPDGTEDSVDTDEEGKYTYLFEGARNYIGEEVIAEATVDGLDDSATHPISEEDFAACSNGVGLSLQGICEPQGQPSIDLLIMGILTRDGNPIPNYPIRLSFPDESTVTLNTDEEGKFSYLFTGAARYLESNIIAVATVDGVDYSVQHQITEDDFEGCGIERGPLLTIQGICEKKAGESESHDLRITGKLTDAEGFEEFPVPNHPITLELPNGNSILLNTDQAGNYSYLFVGADQYLGKRITVVTTYEEELVFPEEDHIITSADFEGCQRTYQCHNVFLTTFHGQPIEPGSQIPGWGLVDTHIVCKGIGQGRSCRLVVKGQPGYVVKSDTLEMDVPRLEPYVQYQAQIKGYDGKWTNQGCEFSFITGGRVASISTPLADQVDPLGWVYLGERRNAIKPLGVCSGWSDACLFADNIIGFHFDDIYGNPLPGSELAGMQPGERIFIYRDHQLHTYVFTGSERVRQSAEGNQAILDAAEQHDLVITTCSGYRLIDAGHFSHTRYATFKLLPRIEPQHQWQ